MALNAAQLYKNNSIQTASPAKLTLMLYDGAIKFMNIAKDGLAENNIEKASNHIIKSEKFNIDENVDEVFLDDERIIYQDFYYFLLFYP